MRCDFDSALGEELDKKISAAREKYSSLCLKCEGDSCKMNIFRPESDPDLEQKRKTVTNSCKRIFNTCSLSLRFQIRDHSFAYPRQLVAIAVFVISAAVLKI